MKRDCGCSDNPLVQSLESAGEAMTRREALAIVGATAGALAVGNLAHAEDDASDGAADAIYHGGPIVTMVKDGDRAEAVVVKKGAIAFVGSKAEALKRKGAKTKVVDLAGRCLMPGFVDPHSHVALQSAKFTTCNLDPKPIGAIGSIADLQDALRTWIREQKIEAGQWVFGWGYDDTGIEEMRHPFKEDLDAVSTEHPIMLLHISSHLMAVNSKALEMASVTASTPDPEGGRIQRKQGSKEPNGVFEELAMLSIIKHMPSTTPEKAMAVLEKGLAYYAAAGITTAQDGASGAGISKLLAAMAEAGKLPIDVVGYPIYKGVDEDELKRIVADKGTTGRFRRGGVKLTVDGSIQGYTAFLSKPYHVQPEGEGDVTPDSCDGETTEHAFVSADTPPAKSALAKKPAGDYRGYANMTVDEVKTWVKRCDENDIQFLAHTNGDGATDLLVEAIGAVRGDKPRPDLRTTIIHAQTMREDQLDFASKHGICPSFFPIHITFWGDRHRDIFLGPERAARISPAKSALRRGMKFTLHHDAPIAGIGMLPVAAAAVNRVTSSGKPLGFDQRITAFEALRAITADAAWQYFEEDRKGTLEAGKVADFVILDADPLAVDPMKIADIAVLETIKGGATVYRKA